MAEALKNQRTDYTITLDVPPLSTVILEYDYTDAKPVVKKTVKKPVAAAKRRTVTEKKAAGTKAAGTKAAETKAATAKTPSTTAKEKTVTEKKTAAAGKRSAR